LKIDQARADRDTPQQQYGPKQIETGVAGESGIEGRHWSLVVSRSLRQTWRPRASGRLAKSTAHIRVVVPSGAPDPAFRRRWHEPRLLAAFRLLGLYCPSITITGAALAITGPSLPAVAASMRMTWPGSGGTSPMRRASTSIRSGSRSDASSRRSA
jgi:hypothetical protein